MPRIRKVFAAALFSFLCSCSLLDASVPGPEKKPLYDRLGGASHIAVMVDEFVDKLMQDPTILRNPVVSDSRERMPDAVLKFHLTNLVCGATGGPEKYTGRPLAATHKGMRITETEWQRMLEIFKDTMDSLSIKPQEQAELTAIVQSTKADIVMR